MASKGQNIEVAEELIKADPSSINITDNKGNTALHIATRKGRAQVVDLVRRAMPVALLPSDDDPRLDELKKLQEKKDICCAVTCKYQESRHANMMDFHSSQQRWTTCFWCAMTSSFLMYYSNC